MPSKHDSKRSKTEALLEEGTLNPTPEKVRDPKFRGREFFDPHDAVQVKYEMLRRVSLDNASVTEASDEYGVSRPTYYQAKANFDAAGIAGLVPRKPGPRGPHKVEGEVLAFLQARLVPGEPVRARELASLIRAELGIEVHPRTIERALKKNCRMNTPRHRRVRSSRPPLRPSMRCCVWQLSAERCRLQPAVASYFFCAGACGGGRRRWPPQAPFHSQLHRVLHQCRVTSAQLSFTCSRQWR